MNIKNNINTYADLTAYNNDKEKDYPNISYIEEDDEVKWNKYDPDHIVAVYNVTSTESATKLLYINEYITYQIIDGVQQQSVQTTYTFDTLGEHIVKYKVSRTDIAGSVFRGCTGLTSVTIPNTVTSIGIQAFFNCTGLSSVTIPDSVTSIVNGAFQGCSSLTSVTIGSGVTSIGEDVFNGCSGLTNITIPNSVTSIGQNAFMSTGLTSFTLPSSVTSVSKQILSLCNNLTTITVDSGNTTFDSRDNCNAIIETSTNTLVQGCKTTVIPNTVTTIGNSAFRNYSIITSITIPNSVTSIGNEAFGNCRGIRSITIPNSVTSIGNEAFNASTGFLNFRILATTPPTLGTSVFYPNGNRKIYVPAESVETYKAASGWSDYASLIQPITE